MNPELRIDELAQDAIATNWSRTLAPMLYEALERGPQWCNLDGLVRDLQEGFAKILVVWHPQEFKVYAVLYVEGDQHQLCNVLRISYCGGVDLSEWIHLYPELRKYAALNGFQQIAFCGRRGWEKLLREYTKTNFVHYTDDLSDLLEKPEAAEAGHAG